MTYDLAKKIIILLLLNCVHEYILSYDEFFENNIASDWTIYNIEERERERERQTQFVVRAAVYFFRYFYTRRANE